MGSNNTQISTWNKREQNYWKAEKNTVINKGNGQNITKCNSIKIHKVEQDRVAFLIIEKDRSSGKRNSLYNKKEMRNMH